MGRKTEILLLSTAIIPFLLFFIDVHYTLAPSDTIYATKDSDRANACILILARNSDLDGVLHSLKSFEANFNSKYKYPYVFLNDKEFSSTFKEQVQSATVSKVEFGKVPVEHWSYPDHVDQRKAKQAREKMKDVLYGSSESYRFMCRYFSGFFYRHELVQKYDWYWRVEPDVDFYCNIDFDPFVFLSKNNQKYAFTISKIEIDATIPSLFQTVNEFIHKYPNLINLNNGLDFLLKSGNYYSKCHFWSNFEIASFSLYRSEQYEKFFEFLDLTGNFFYERWGDAPVHTLAVGLFLDLDQVHYFENIGYRHDDTLHCPIGRNCGCDMRKSEDASDGACAIKWKKLTN